MLNNATSLRPFIGSKDFLVSSSFYKDLGFEEVTLGPGFSLFRTGKLAFYLQDYYAREWIENTMVFLEVDDVEQFWKYLEGLDLPARYEGVKLTPIRKEQWGSECFVHDPAGVLWHFGAFAK
ncbi:glyoxalase [Dyadobacter sandarakinus]|uniref:Glyoxalase n=1 Tax=Dyadobacter sandarakinus TaxID=2747268 RepID=A0ABX7I570_9BACT|nr:glyoxalase [Dyadobacter sandarakinus]QRR00682.1 glyoxalase [Dyadobacter sandarakinus]